MYSFETRKPVHESYHAHSVRSELRNHNDWNSSLKLLWRLERPVVQGQSPQSTERIPVSQPAPATSFPLHCVRAARHDTPFKDAPKAAVARSILDRFVVRQKRTQQPEQVSYVRRTSSSLTVSGLIIEGSAGRQSRSRWPARPWTSIQASFRPAQALFALLRA